MARSEYWSGPLRLPTPAAAHVAIASGVSQRVTSPRRTRARSYSAQFPTRYVVLYVPSGLVELRDRLAGLEISIVLTGGWRGTGEESC